MSLVQSLVAPLSFGLGDSAITPTGNAWDIFIGNVPFMLDPSQNAPFRIKSVGQTLYRYDTSNQAGEQTLGAWWLRSQTSFHGGAGQTYLDGTDPTISPDIASLRFDSSKGVDVWTPGAVKLLNDTKRVSTAAQAGGKLMAALDSTTPVLFYSDGASLYRWDGTTQTTVTWGGTGTILSLTQDGVNYYAADATGIYKGTLDGANGALIWNTGSSNVLISWIKQRLMAAIGTSIYELDGSGPALPAAKFTHPESGWRWDALADGPSAIYTAGHMGSEAIIYKFVLDSSGGVPALTTGISAATLPIGEYVTALQNHTDTWLAIGTTNGLRIAQFTSGGDLSMDLIVNHIGGACLALNERDRFIYSNFVASDDIATLARLDLTLAIKNGLFALASDLRANDRSGDVDSFQTGSVTGIATFGAATAFLVDGVGVFVEDTANVVQQGTLVSSRVRYDTSEAKIFDAVRWHGEAPGTIECDVAIDSTANGRLIGILSSTTQGFDSFDVPILMPGGAFATITLILRPSSDGVSPTLSGWLLKALPMQSRVYQIMLPLSCYDKETLGNGKDFGHEGWSLERLDAIMEMADEQRSQVLQQIAGPKAQRRNMRVVIDDIDYQQVMPPGLATRTGGLLYLTLRTV